MAYPSTMQEADSLRLEQAAAFNHRELFKKEAITLGGSYFDTDGLCWTSGNAQSPSMVAFPQLTEANAGQQLDELMDFYRKFPPKGAGCWSLDPASPPDLGIRLLARGFQPGWRPRWMGLDLNEVRTDHPFPRGLTIVTDNQISLTDVKNLPYAHVIVPAASTTDMPGQWMRFVASLHGKVVGHSVVFLTSGDLGAAGIYHVGVVPRHRKKGIGKAVTLAACLYARDQGYRYAVLNSTSAGQRTYEQLGFSVIRDGWTWWLITDRYLSRPPSPPDVQLAEAVGRGDRQSLDALRPQLQMTSRYLNRELSNGLTLMELAVHCRQPSAAEWLVGAGANYTVLDAWDLGWLDRARQMLQKDPSSVNRSYGEWNKTLLHFAAERNDADLTRLALTARPDLRMKDSAYQSTALEWARHLGHTHIMELLQDAR
ncbi:GNAT family N-acetyltransferase [Puia sp. P3]|uniref:GNAT family N-acetyltransferase n=1 Tax=Puia sp. P3 TaxID=3423952 RepID=UPI003D674B3F